MYAKHSWGLGIRSQALKPTTNSTKKRYLMIENWHHCCKWLDSCFCWWWAYLLLLLSAIISLLSTIPSAFQRWLFCASSFGKQLIKQKGKRKCKIYPQRCVTVTIKRKMLTNLLNVNSGERNPRYHFFFTCVCMCISFLSFVFFSFYFFFFFFNQQTQSYFSL